MSGPVRVRLGWAAVLVLIAALEFAASYRGASAVLVLVAAALVPFAVVRGLQALRLGVFGPAMITIVLATGGAWLALRRTAGPLGGLGDAVPRLLTNARPAPATAALLAPAVLAVALVATLVAAAVCARSSTRVPGLVAPVVGACALYVAAQLLAAGTADRYGIAAAGLVVVAALGWSGRSLRPTSSTAVLTVVAVAGLALASLALPRATPYDARQHVTPPSVRLQQPSPLTQLATWSVNPSLSILRVRATGVTRLHLASLVRFTGDNWQVDDRYRPLGVVSAGVDLPDGGRQVPTSAVVQVVRLGGVWLPSAGRTRQASLPDVLVDPDTATLARTEPTRPGLTYTLRGTADAPTDRQLTTAAVPASPPSVYLALPDAPSAFAQYARQVVRGASTPLEEAIALENAVAEGRRLDTQAPSGSSYARLQSFLFAPRGTAGAREGSDEQFAAAFAVLARAVGLPSRLTVGFRLDSAGPRTVTVRGRDATVWPELYFSGIGWVPFSPTPGGGSAGGDADSSGLRQTVLKRLADRAQELPPVQGGGTAARPPAHHVADRGAVAPAPSHRWWWVGLVIGVLVVVVGGLLALRRRRSRHHRRRGAVGAWSEFEDLLVLTGRPPDPARTAVDLATAFDHAHPGAGGRAVALAEVADRAAFAPSVSDGAGGSGAHPGAHFGADNGVVDDGVVAWREVRLLRREALQVLPAHRRWVAPLDPRPLLRGGPVRR